MLCAVFSLCYEQSLVCVMCSLQSRASSLRSEHASLRSVGKGPRAEIIYICWVQHQYINAFWVRHQDMSIFQSMSKKIDLVDKTNPTKTLLFLMALVRVFGHFRFGQIRRAIGPGRVRSDALSLRSLVFIALSFS